MAEGDGLAHDSWSHALLTRGHFCKTRVDTEQAPCLQDLSGECSRQEKKKKKKPAKVQRPKGSINCKEMKEEKVATLFTPKILKNNQRGPESVQKYGT